VSRWPTSSEAPATTDAERRDTTAGRLIVLSGPAGVGKSTVAEQVCRRLGLRRSVSATTRPPRADEVAGRDYLFVTKEEFRDGIARGEFLEHALVHEQLYGTPRQPIERAVAAGESRLLVIDVQGAMQVQEHRPDSLFIFLDAPDDATLCARLAQRGTEDPAERETRLVRASIERTYKEHYDYVVINDDLDRAVSEVCDIIARDRRRNDRRQSLDG
jgi:guanylate kinase